MQPACGSRIRTATAGRYGESFPPRNESPGFTMRDSTSPEPSGFHIGGGNGESAARACGVDSLGVAPNSRRWQVSWSLSAQPVSSLDACARCWGWSMEPPKASATIPVAHLVRELAARYGSRHDGGSPKSLAASSAAHDMAPPLGDGTLVPHPEVGPYTRSEDGPSCRRVRGSPPGLQQVRILPGSHLAESLHGCPAGRAFGRREPMAEHPPSKPGEGTDQNRSVASST